MTDRQKEEKSAGVSDGTKRAEDALSRWSWAEPCVWTERMLTTLEVGVKGGKWFSLIDKVYSKRALQAGFATVRAKKGSAGVDHQTVAMFESRLDENLERLGRELREESYRPRAVRRVWIPKVGRKERRPLGIPAVRDRVVQAALRHVLEPIFEREFAERSYGFRPGRGCKDALRRVDALLKKGHTHVVDVDLQDYFGSIPHDGLMARVKEKVSDGRVLALISSYLKADVMDTASRWTPQGGTPQGAVISPLLSNIYLNPLDHQAVARGFEMVRYADDMVILCRSRKEAEAALEMVKDWTAENGLRLHPEKTRIVDAKEECFTFLGYQFGPNGRWPSPKSLKSLKDRIRVATRRTNGHSLEYIITTLNRVLRGWFEYYKHARWYIFERLDRWLRMRLRAILRKRKLGGGYPKGYDYNRWPNSFFAKSGLLSLLAAYKRLRWSATR